MLAKHNIGQVFSENPVEALAVLKDQKITNPQLAANVSRWEIVQQANRKTS